MPRYRRLALALAFAITLVAVEIALELWRSRSWPADFGAPYALTARLFLGGERLYAHVAAAQPPPLFWTGAGALAIDDSAQAIRILLGAVSAATACLVGLATFRLTGQRAVASIAGIASVLTPWSLNQHAVFTPEPFAAFLLLGSALLLPMSRRGGLAGALAGIATAFKLVYLLPALLLALAPGERRSYGLGLAATLTLLSGSFLALYGGQFFDGVVVAQAQSGTHTLHELGGLIAQGGWNLVPLLLAAFLGVCRMSDLLDQRLATALLALLVGELLSFASLAKNGTYLNILAVAEPVAVVLTAAGIWSALAIGGQRWLGLVAVVATLLVVAQSASLLMEPSNARLFLRPFSAPAHGPSLSLTATQRATSRARACPASAAYSGPPSVAFLADRRVPGDQPDLFIVRAPVQASARAEIAADTRRCP